MKTITICASASFYRQVVELKRQLEALGYRVLVPHVAEKMAETGDYEVDHYKTWFADPNDYHKKTELMEAHFAKVIEGDMTLVLNYEKHGQPNYIGGNVLMEMVLAYHYKKPIYVLNDAPKESGFIEEILGLKPIFMKGDLSRLQVDAIQAPVAAI